MKIISGNFIRSLIISEKIFFQILKKSHNFNYFFQTQQKKLNRLFCSKFSQICRKTKTTIFLFSKSSFDFLIFEKTKKLNRLYVIFSSTCSLCMLNLQTCFWRGYQRRLYNYNTLVKGHFLSQFL